MNDPIEEFEQHGLVVKIYPDDDTPSPREDDNLGHMVCWHLRRNLGDERIGIGEHGRTVKEVEQWLVQTRQALIVLPLWIYEHGQVTMTAREEVYQNYPDKQWDAGQVGFIYITAEKIREEYSEQVSAELLQKVREYLRSEVDVYDQYLQGDVWGYVIQEPPGEEDGEPGKELASCWGYYGLEYAREAAEAAAGAIGKKEDNPT